MTSVLFLSNNSIDKIDIFSNEHTSSVSGNNAIGENTKDNSKFPYAMLLPSDFPKGYIGKVKIIREYEKPEIIVSNRVTTKSISYNSPINDASDNLISYGNGSGNYNGYGDDDFGLPVDKPYLPPVRNNWDISGNKYNIDILINRSAVAIIAQPKWPYKANMNDTGVVEIIFTINKDGYIPSWDDIEIIKEIPRNRGFGKSVKSAIYYRSKFQAAVKNGKPEDSKVKIVITMCQECESYVASQKGMFISVKSNE